ncbi:MAG: transposase [Pseudomonadota bacterium]
MRNALNPLPRKADVTACRSCVGCMSARPGGGPRRSRRVAGEMEGPQDTAWVEETIDETFIHRLPRRHHKHLKSANMLERLNEEIKWRTYVLRICPNAESACASSSS